MKLKRIVASCLACAMAFSTASTVFAADTNDLGDGTLIDQPSTVTTPVIAVALPTTADIAVNVFSAGDSTNSQIYSATQTIVNKSSIPVQVSVKAAIAPKNGVTVNVLEKASLVDNDDTTDKTKNVYVEAVALTGTWTPDAGDATDVTFAATASGNTGYVGYTANGADTVCINVVKGKTASADAAALSDSTVLTFALDQATDADNGDPFVADGLAANNKGVAAYRLMGSANTYADWDPGDFNLKVVYNVTGLPGTMYNALVANSTAYGASNMVDTHIEKVGIKNGANFVNTVTFTATDGVYAAPALTVDAKTGNSNITIDSIKSVELIDAESGVAVPTGNGMTYIKASKALNVMPTWVTLANGPLKNSSSVKVKITFYVTDTKHPVNEGDPSREEYIIVTLAK